MGKKKNIFPYVLIIPGIILLTVLMFLPFIRNLLYSFTNYKLANPHYTQVGIANYLKAFSNREFWNSLRVTIIWVFLNMVLMIPVGMLAAFVINSKQIKGGAILELVLLIPWVLPESVTGYIWKLLLTYQSGVYYRLLSFLHFIPEKFDLFADSNTAMLCVVIANVWRSFPLIALAVLAKLRTVPQEQIEAGVLDGCKRKDLFFYIEFPNIRPVLVSVGTLCFIWTFGAYGIISVMTDGGPAKATQVVTVLMQKAAFQFFDYATASTYALMIMAISVAMVVILRSLPKLALIRNRR